VACGWNRNSIITTGNGGTEPTKAALTLFYGSTTPKSSYTIEKVLQPGEQIWADVRSLIQTQLPDKDGKVIPHDVTMGSYELRDVQHYGVGQLYEGKLVIDKTWGHGYYGCAACCGYDVPDPICATSCKNQAGACTTGCSTTATQTYHLNGFTITKSPSYQCNQVVVQ